MLKTYQVFLKDDSDVAVEANRFDVTDGDLLFWAIHLEHEEINCLPGYPRYRECLILSIARGEWKRIEQSDGGPNKNIEPPKFDTVNEGYA